MVKYWNDFVGSVFFNRVFSAPVEINEIKLFSLRIDNNASVVTLGFDIRELPDKPPRKWESIQFNACRIGIECSEVSDLLIKNLPELSVMNVSIIKQDSRFRISIESNSSLIEFTATYLRLHDPSVYFTQDAF